MQELWEQECSGFGNNTAVTLVQKYAYFLVSFHLSLKNCLSVLHSVTLAL